MELTLSLYQFGAAMVYLTIFTLLLSCRRLIAKANPIYKSAYNLVLVTILLIGINFIVQSLFQFRDNNEHYIGTFVNLVLLIPAYNISNFAIITILTNKNIEKRFTRGFVIFYLIVLVIYSMGILVDKETREMLSSIGGLLFLLNVTWGGYRVWKRYKEMRRNLDNYYSINAGHTITWTFTATRLIHTVIFIVPLAIIIKHEYAVFIAITLFTLVMMYYVINIVNFSRYSEITYRTRLLNSNCESDNSVTEEISEDEYLEEIENGENKENTSEESEDEEQIVSEQILKDIKQEKDNDSMIEKPNKESVIAGAVKEKLDVELQTWMENKGYCQQGVTIHTLARELGTNQKYLSQYVNTCIGKTFREWINELRVEEAKRLIMADSELTFEMVTKQVGFVSRTHFQTIFNQVCGTTPAKWRKGLV